MHLLDALVQRVDRHVVVFFLHALDSLAVRLERVLYLLEQCLLRRQLCLEFRDALCELGIFLT